MFFKLKDISYRHFHNNFFLYLIVVICLLIGISAGAITIKVLSTSQKQELINYLDSFFKILNENQINSLLLLKQSIINNLQTVLLIWILGITVVGVPVIMGVVALRGFVIGFTVGFLFDELGFKGLLFSLLAVLPQNIFVIPGIVIVSVIAIRFSVTLVKSRMRKSGRLNFGSVFLYYTSTVVMVSIILLIGSLAEAYISPVFMRLISGFIS